MTHIRSTIFVIVLLFGFQPAEAVEMNFVLDPIRSQLKLAGYMSITIPDGYPSSIPEDFSQNNGWVFGRIDEMGTGSLITGYAGNLKADVDVTGNSIQFSSGSQIAAQNSGDWFPAGDQGEASPANYGARISIQIPSLDQSSIVDLAFRNFVFDLKTPALSIASDGSFDAYFATVTPITAEPAAFYYSSSNAYFGTFQLGQMKINFTHGGKLTKLSGNQYEIQLPLQFNIIHLLEPQLDVNIDAFAYPLVYNPNVIFEGMLVGVATIPEVSPIMLLLIVVVPLIAIRVASRRFNLEIISS